LTHTDDYPYRCAQTQTECQAAGHALVVVELDAAGIPLRGWAEQTSFQFAERCPIVTGMARGVGLAGSGHERGSKGRALQLSVLAKVAIIGLAAQVVGCTDKAQSAGGGSAGGTSASGGAMSNVGGADHGAAGAVSTGGTAAGGSAMGGMGGANQPMTLIRFMQVYLKDGAKTSYDLWARRNDQTWVSLVRHLDYGELTDYIEVPLGAGRNTMIWYIPPGDDPAKYAISIGSFINYHLADSDTGRHTSFMFHVPGVEDWATEFITDADPELTPPPGYAYVLFSADAIRPANPVLDYGEKAACVDRATQDGYQPIAVGTHTFAVYSGESASDCNGSVLATAPSTTIGDGEVWLLHAIGDKANDIELRPVKLTRD